MKNEGMADRVVRGVIGIIVLALAWFALGLGSGAPLGILAGVVGGVLLITGLVGFCPGYRLLGIRTCPIEPGSS
jgi:hypothetical protein